MAAVLTAVGRKDAIPTVTETHILKDIGASCAIVSPLSNRAIAPTTGDFRHCPHSYHVKLDRIVGLHYHYHPHVGFRSTELASVIFCHSHNFNELLLQFQLIYSYACRKFQAWVKMEILTKPHRLMDVNGPYLRIVGCVEFNCPFDRCDNNSGMTVLDITNISSIRYCQVIWGRYLTNRPNIP